MSIDFHSMVQKVKRDQEVRARDEATKGANDKVERTKIIEDGVACLQIYVLPMLEQAKSAFESEGISVHIRKNFDVHHYCNVKPSLVFVCAGPSKQNKRGGISEPKSIPAFFSSDGAKIEIAFGKYAGAHGPDGPVSSPKPEAAERPIADAIKKVLDSYCSEVDRLRRSGLWS